MLLIASIAPFMVWLATRYRDEVRTALLLWTATICLVIAGFAELPRLSFGLWYPVAVGFFGALYAARMSRILGEDGDGAALWRRPLHVIGAAGLAVMLFAGSFAESWRDLARTQETAHGVGSTIAAGVIAVGFLAFSSWRGFMSWKAGQVHQGLLALTPLLLTAFWGLSFRQGSDGMLMLVVNALGLCVGVASVNAGLKHGQLGTANAGLLLVVSLIVARFFDDDWSFIIRGVGFILMGIVFLVMNLWLLRRRGEVRS